ncbi:MAG: hypothetical protein ACYC8T_00995 [Myxococcaceae bacterium]
MHQRRSVLWALLICAGFAASCKCNAPPVKQGLKPEGVPCGADAECETGLCDALPAAEKLCMRKCTSECKESEVCTLLGLDRYGCVPERAGLCDACTKDSDCPYPADRCMRLGDERICGRDCSFDNKCPSSFRCVEGTALDGALVANQCQPTSGTCKCTVYNGGQEIPCEETNAIGTCTGKKRCVPPAGYGLCSAHVPADEACNGIDDDCNGQMDEDLGDTSCGVGECARTVANCANGAPQTCIAGDAGVESCDEKDNDCDTVVDNGFDKQGDVANCGTCGNACSLPNATPACVGGLCTVASCNPGFWDIDLLPANGCEYACVVTNGGVEICDGLDNDCNKVVDDGFSTVTDPLNCGTCGRVCNVANGHVATYACGAGNCGIATCDVGYADCDQVYTTGCEVNTTSSLTHCSGCNLPCTTPHATPTCDQSQCKVLTCDTGWKDCNTLVPDGCEIDSRSDLNNCGTCTNTCSFPNATPDCTNSICGYTCLPNFWDLDGNAANGCEYACTFVASVDLPDLGFVDANCDGIDGEVTNGIFVAPPAAGGNNANSGTRAAPKATITGGMTAAVATSKRDVYVAQGSYGETVAPSAGKGVYGGYQAGTWSRSMGNAVSVVGTNPPLLIDSASNTSVQLMSFIGANATGLSASGYGALIRNSASVLLEGLTITAGAGSTGQGGGIGSTGASGLNGGPGQPGCEESSGLCSGCPRPLGGAGGTSSCGRTGGVGGQPGRSGSAGDPGGTGTGGTAGGAGRGCCQGNSTAPAVNNGATGATPGPAASGVHGSGFGTVNVSGYVPALTTHGLDGLHGNGGGGAGAGGGGVVNCDSYGSAGGGGGAGGCGGQGGRRGESGGASIGIFLYNSSVTGNAVSITSGNGGQGGNGGSGGSGGSPGYGGGTSYGGGSEQDDGSNGGTGGRGGYGGLGGPGGAGGGGPTIGVVSAAFSSWNPINGTTIATGTAGAAGTSPGGSGQPGLNQATYP